MGEKSLFDRIKLISQLIRTRQWIKNLFVLAPLVFSLNLFNRQLFIQSVEAFIAFSLVASAIYVVNDLFDIERDRIHPEKQKRPLPSGRISVNLASFIGFICLLGGVSFGLAVNPITIAIVAVYAVMNLIYSYWAKHVIILDAMIISIGFVLRVLAGSYAIMVHPSSWLIVATFFLALLMALAKRYNEISIMQEYSSDHRIVLNKYSLTLLQQMISIVSGTTILAYALYCIDREVVQAFHTEYLIYTVPFVVYGIFRYLYLVFSEQKGGDPTELVLRDRPMQINLLLWIITVVILIY